MAEFAKTPKLTPPDARPDMAFSRLRRHSQVNDKIPNKFTKKIHRNQVRAEARGDMDVFTLYTPVR